MGAYCIGQPRFAEAFSTSLACQAFTYQPCNNAWLGDRRWLVTTGGKNGEHFMIYDNGIARPTKCLCLWQVMPFAILQILTHGTRMVHLTVHLFCSTSCISYVVLLVSHPSAVFMLSYLTSCNRHMRNSSPQYSTDVLCLASNQTQPQW